MKPLSIFPLIWKPCSRTIWKYNFVNTEGPVSSNTLNFGLGSWGTWARLSNILSIPDGLLRAFNALKFLRSSLDFPEGILKTLPLVSQRKLEVVFFSQKCSIWAQQRPQTDMIMGRDLSPLIFIHVLSLISKC